MACEKSDGGGFDSVRDLHGCAPHGCLAAAFTTELGGASVCMELGDEPSVVRGAHERPQGHRWRGHVPRGECEERN